MKNPIKKIDVSEGILLLGSVVWLFGFSLNLEPFLFYELSFLIFLILAIWSVIRLKKISLLLLPIFIGFAFSAGLLGGDIQGCCDNINKLGVGIRAVTSVGAVLLLLLMCFIFARKDFLKCFVLCLISFGISFGYDQIFISPEERTSKEDYALWRIIGYNDYSPESSSPESSSESETDDDAEPLEGSCDDDVGYGCNEYGSNENLKLGYGINDRIPAPEGWEILVQGDFTVYAPVGWTLIEEQGIDSYVGTILGDGITLRYDYGQFVGLFSQNSDFDPDSYEVLSTKINGFDATIYTQNEPNGRMVLNIVSPRGAGHFSLEGTDLTPEQKEIVLQIFRTVFFAQ